MKQIIVSNIITDTAGNQPRIYTKQAPEFVLRRVLHAT